MKITAIVPELMVNDPLKTIAFYCDVLGFEVEAAAPSSERPLWLQLHRDGLRLMAQRRAEFVMELPVLADRTTASSMLLVFRCSADDVRQFAERNRAATERCIAFRQSEYGTVEAGVFDPDGNIVLLSGETGEKHE